jgi:hypothetical protein
MQLITNILKLKTWINLLNFTKHISEFFNILWTSDQQFSHVVADKTKVGYFSNRRFKVKDLERVLVPVITESSELWQESLKMRDQGKINLREISLKVILIMVITYSSKMQIKWKLAS